MTQPEVREIFRKIANGENRHGSFLTTFSKALIAADDDNFVIMLTAAQRLIEKYALREEYAHNAVQP